MNNTLDASHREYRQFYSLIGFDDDPFAYTNADEEDRLAEYFIPPPYFASVFGNPDKPKSFVVFAPRGGGKSAQRRMIEEACTENKVFAITYSQFEFPSVRTASDVGLHHHLQNIIRFALIGLLASIYSDESLRDRLSPHDREVIVRLATQHLSDINEYSIKRAMDSLKSLKDRVQAFWNAWLPIINLGVSVLLKKVLGADAELDEYHGARSRKAPMLKYQLELLVGLSRKLGYQSIYVLIDRVDEAELTGNDAQASFKLIEESTEKRSGR